MALIIKTKQGALLPESVMRLELVETPHNKVQLRGTDADGREWILAVIGEDGLYLWTGISKSSGWPLDSEGRIALTIGVMP